MRTQLEAIRTEWQSTRERMIASVNALESTHSDAASPIGNAASERVIPNARYIEAGHRRGFVLDNMHWYAGERTPWGLLQGAYKGGAIIDGVDWSFVKREQDEHL